MKDMNKFLLLIIAVLLALCFYLFAKIGGQKTESFFYSTEYLLDQGFEFPNEYLVEEGGNKELDIEKLHELAINWKNATSLVIDTKEIDRDSAEMLMGHRTRTSTFIDTTDGVYFTLPEIFAGIRQLYATRDLESARVLNSAMMVYFAKYPDDHKDEELRGQSTVVLQIVKPGINEQTKEFNFGELCPIKCPDKRLEPK